MRRRWHQASPAEAPVSEGEPPKDPIVPDLGPLPGCPPRSSLEGPEKLTQTSLGPILRSRPPPPPPGTAQENEVSALVAVPVQKQVEQRLNRRESLGEDDVSALQLLSVALRSQLRFEALARA